MIYSYCSVSVISALTVILAIVSLNHKFHFLPFHGYLLGLYTVFIFTISSWISFSLLQSLLKRNKPFKINFEKLNFKTIINFIYKRTKSCFQNDKSERKTKLELKLDLKNSTTAGTVDDRIDEFIKDVECRFILKWYQYVSSDEQFPKETQKLLDGSLRKFLQVVVLVDNKKLLYGILSLFLNHVKEFRKSVKRAKRNGKYVEDVYCFSHTYNVPPEKLESFVYQLTTEILKQFINWELYFSLPCKVLISILARKLVMYMLNYLSCPGFLNYQILKMCQVNKPKNIEVANYSSVKLLGVDIINSEKKEVKEDVSVVECITNDVKEVEIIKDTEKNKDENDLHKDSTEKINVILRKPPKFSQIQNTEKVKIYKPKSSNKTWRNSTDLLSISLGRDLLEVQNDNDPDSEFEMITEHKLWKDDPENDTSLYTHHHTMKDLQLNTDEAAGMVEGIWDFSKAHLKRGLQLTENFTDFATKHLSEHKIKDETHRSIDLDTSKPTRSNVSKSKSVISDCEDVEESVWINPLKESLNYDGNILLDSSEESSMKNIKTGNEISKKYVPQIAEDVLVSKESPEPEYEEAADFASTIAKLRTLLQQKSNESGISTPSLSPMMVEDSCRRPDDDSGEVTAVQAEEEMCVDGTMPSLYKFCTRAATGVFQNTLNTIKTALPGNVAESDINVHYNVENWVFIDSKNNDFQCKMEKLIAERKVFCSIDTAYEAISSLDVVEHPEMLWTTCGLELDDDLDELGFHMPSTKIMVDIVCELLSDCETSLTRESSVKLFLLFFGHKCENILNDFSETLVHGFSQYVGKLPENTNENTLTMDLDEMVEWCVKMCPDFVRKLIDDKDLKSAIQFLILSLQNEKINRHLLVQIFELCASELISADNKFTPKYSA